MENKKEPAEMLCEMIREGKLSNTINSDGTLTDEAKESIERGIAESEEAFRSQEENLKASRRFTAEDLNFYIGPTKENPRGG
jgi:hypothetical protein